MAYPAFEAVRVSVYGVRMRNAVGTVLLEAVVVDLPEAVDKYPNRTTGGYCWRECCRNCRWRPKGQRHPLTSRTMVNSAIGRGMDRTPGQCTARAAAKTTNKKVNKKNKKNKKVGKIFSKNLV